MLNVQIDENSLRIQNDKRKNQKLKLKVEIIEKKYNERTVKRMLE